MSSKVYSVPPKGDATALRKEINDVLLQISQDLASQRGEGGRPVRIYGPLDLNNQRIMRVGQTTDATDVPSKAELQRFGLYDNGNGHMANGKVILAKGATIPEHDTATIGMNNDEVITKADMRKLLIAWGVLTA